MIRLGTALFAHKGESVEVIKSKINMSGIAGLKTSMHRDGVSGSCKLSSVGKLFDLLFMYPGTLAVYQNDDLKQVYVEQETNMGTVQVLADGKSYKASDSYEISNPVYHLIADTCWELVFGKNDELRSTFSTVSMGWNMKGSVSKEDVLLFCDSYYYGCAKDKGMVIDDSEKLTEDEIAAGFRSGMFNKASVFYEGSLEHQMKTSKYDTASSVKKKAKKAKAENFLTDCIDGKYIIPYEWPEEMQKFIIQSNFLKTFEVTKEFEEIVRKISFHANKILERMDMGLTGAEAIGKDALNIMLLGKPGTGKTTLAYALSAALGMPVCTTAWNKHSDEDEVEGKTKIVDGKPAFVETNSLVFHQYGGIDVNEEINLADPSVTMGALGQKLEYPYIVKKNGYETVTRHPLNVVIATMNVGTNGSNSLNQALANRFKTPYILDDPTRETFINILMKSSGKNRDVCEWVYGAYEATVQYLKDPDVNEDDICQNLSIRTCLGAIENMEEGQTPVRALINSIVGAVAVVDVEVARNLQHERIENLPNPKFEL